MRVKLVGAVVVGAVLMLAPVGSATPGSADLSLQTTGPATLAVGATGSFAFTVSNAGPDAADGVVLTITLPSTVRLSSSSNAGGSGACTTPSGPGGTVTCNRGTVASGGSGTVTLGLQAVAAGSTPIGSTVTSTTSDPNPGAETRSSALTTTPSNADLSAGIFAPATALLGSTVSWNVAVGNGGPDPVSNAVLTITLPASTSTIGFSFAGSTSCFYGAQITCFGTGPLVCSIPNPEPSPPVVTCSASTLAAGQSQSFTLFAHVNAVGLTTVSASVTSQDLADPSLGNNTASASTTVQPSADLGLTLTAPGNAGVGDQFDYALRVQNAGPSAATGVTTTTTLPAAVELVSAPAGCSGTTTVACTFGGIPIGGSATKTLRLRALALGNATIASSVDGAEADPAGGNDATSAIVSITSTPLPPGADLGVTTGGPASLAVGASGSFTFTVLNNGPDPATDTVLTLTIPSRLRVSSTNNAGATVPCSSSAPGSPGGTVTCNRGTLTNLQSATVTIGLVAVSAGAASIGAAATTTAADPVAANNTATHAVQINPSNANLFIGISAPARVHTGDSVAFSISAGNGGPDPVGAATLTIPLPAAFSATGFSFPGSTSCFFGAQTTCFGNGPFVCSFPTPQPSPVTITCTTGGLAAGASQTFTLYATANSSGTHTVTGTVSGTDVADPTAGDNSSTATVRVFDGAFPAEADLQVTKTAPATAQPGQQFDYTVTVRNNGPDTATAVTVADPLPAQVSFVSATGATCTGAPTLSCDFGSLTNFQSKTATIRVQATAEGTATNTATVSAAETDLVSSNNAATATTTIRQPTSDLELTVTGPATVEETRTATYSLVLRNLGPDNAANVRVRGTLTAGLTLDYGNYDCYAVGGGFECFVGTVWNGFTETLSLRLRGDAVGPQTLGLDVTQNNADPDSTNHVRSVAIEVVPRPRVDVSATLALPPQVVVGETFEYTVTIANAGPNTVGSVHVGAYFPAAAFDSEGIVAPASGCHLSLGSATIGSGVLADGVICTAGPLAAGASTQVSVSLRAVAAGSQLFVAQGSSNGLEIEVDSSNNVDIENLLVVVPLAISCPADVAVSTDPGLATAAVVAGPPTFTGGSAPVTVAGVRSDGAAIGAPFPIGVTTIEWTAADAASQSQSCTQTVTVSDTEPPTISAPPDITIGTDDGLASANVADLGAPSAADNSGAVSVASSGAPAGNVFPLGTTTITWTATDAAGNTATATQAVTVADDDPPVTQATAPAGWQTTVPVVVALSATDAASGVREIRYTVGGVETVVPGDTASVSVTGEGLTEIGFHAVDNAGNAEEPQTVTVRIDTLAPSLACGAPDGLWHAGNVTFGCTATDGGSGLAAAGDAAFSLTTSVGPGQVDANAATGSRQVCDVAGNCATAGPIAGNKVDREAPTVTIAVPLPGATFTQGSSVSSSFACADGAGSGIATCAGPATVPTTVLGPRVFTVTATDGAGNSTTRTVSYTVTLPELCQGRIARQVGPPIDADGGSVFKQGRTVPVKFRMCDGAGNPISTPGLVTDFALVRMIAGATTTYLHADPVSTTPVRVFRWSADERQWIFNLATANLAVGRTYVYRISLSDGTSFEFRFSLR